MHSENSEKVPAFLYKLWRLVEDRRTDELIRWRPDGKSFVLYHQGRFSRELLPQYYKHNNMASFVRQLNMYGFRKVPSLDGGGLRPEKDEVEFAHPCFIRGQDHKLELIKRKVSTGAGSNKLMTVQLTTGRQMNTGSIVTLDDARVGDIMSEVVALRQKQNTVNSQLKTLKEENELIWNQYSSLEAKFNKQQHILQKLMTFLVTVVKQPSSARGGRRFPTLATQNAFTSNMRMPAITHRAVSEGPLIHEVTDDLLLASDASSSQPQQQQQPQVSVLGTTGSDTRVVSTAVDGDVDGVQEQQFLHTIQPGQAGEATSTNVLLLPEMELADGQFTGLVDTLPLDNQGAVLSEDLAVSMSSPNPLNSLNLSFSSGDDVSGYMSGSSVYTAELSPTPMVASPQGTILSAGRSSTGRPSSQQVTVSVGGAQRDVTLTSAPMMAANSPTTTLSTPSSAILPATSRDASMVDFRKGKSVKIVRPTAEQNIVTANRVVPHTRSFTIGPNNTLIPNGNLAPTSVVFSNANTGTSDNSNNDNFLTVIKQEVMPGSDPNSSGGGGGGGVPVLTRTVRQQQPIVTSISVIPAQSEAEQMSGPSSKPRSATIRGVPASTQAHAKKAVKRLRNEDFKVQPSNSIITTSPPNSNSSNLMANQQLISNSNTIISNPSNYNNSTSSLNYVIPSNRQQQAILTAGGGPMLRGESRSSPEGPVPQQQTGRAGAGAATATAGDTLAAGSSCSSGASPTASNSSVPMFRVIRRGSSAAAPPLSPFSTDDLQQQQTVATSAALHFVSEDDGGATGGGDALVPASPRDPEEVVKNLDDTQAILDSLQELMVNANMQYDQNSLLNIFNSDIPMADLQYISDLAMQPNMDATGHSQHIQHQQ